MGKSLTLALLIVFSLIIAVFSALAITYYILPEEKSTELSLDQKWSNYNNFEIRNGQKIPVGSSSEAAINPPTTNIPQNISPKPDLNKNEAKPSVQNNDEVSTNKTKRIFNWNHQNKNFTLELWLESSINYETPKSFSSETEYYSKFLATDPKDNSIKDIAKKLKSLALKNRLNDDQLLDLLASFVQSIPYVTVSGAPPKFPYRTLMDNAGDCDDKSLLTYNIMKELGYKVSIISFPGHMAVGVGCPIINSLNNSGFTYLEAAGPAKNPIGKIPPNRVGQNFSLLLSNTGGKIYHSLPNRVNA